MQLPALPRSVRALRPVMLAWAVISPGLWSHYKVHFAIVAPIVATALLIGALVELAAPRASNRVVLALVASGVVVLLVWITAVAMPLVTKGRLPDGRYLAEVLARQRILRQHRRDRRQALRQRRDNPTYPGPHAHRHQDQDRPGEDD